MGHKKCLICHKAEATKKNSHLIPSFIIAKVCSYDGSGKRDREIMFTIDSFKDKVYVGNLPSTKLDELFDQDTLTDERIDQELKDNTMSMDYIFCPDCEEKLSILLESPYAESLSKGKVISPDISYFFWLSVIWRMSVSGRFQFKLPVEIEENLGDCLYEYMVAKSNGQDVEAVIEKCCFSYQLLRCSAYCTQHSAFFYGKDMHDPLLITYIFGNTIICAHFDRENISFPQDYSFLGLESLIKSALINNGSEVEKCTNIDSAVLTESTCSMVDEVAKMRLGFEKELADEIWKQIGLSGKMPKKIFIEFMKKLYADDVKIGDRRTPERYIQAFNDTLISSGYVARDETENK